MTVALAWTDAKNPPGTKYDVYRSPYSGVNNYIKIASAVAGTAYTDVVTLPGAFTYYVTAILDGGVESDSSNTATATPPVFPPTLLTATVT
jgi:fibronectin type 3 domain-containing protein